MRSKQSALAILGTAAIALGAATVASGSSAPALVIRHQTRGCHAWSLNRGPYVSHEVVRVAHGGSLTVVDNDVMAQELVKTSGPTVHMTLVHQSHMGSTMPMGKMMGNAGPYTMSHMGATLEVTFPRAGTYRFKLVDRGDYFEVQTKGPDNELTLEVVVR